MGFTLIGMRDPGVRAELRQRAGGRRTDRRGFVDLSSGVLAHRPSGIGRPPRTGAVDFPGGRQCRQRDRSAARRLDHHSARPDAAWRGLRWRRLLAIAVLARVGAWYKRQHLDRPAGSQRRAAARESGVAAHASHGRSCILVMLIFSKYFYVASITQLLQFLPDREIPSSRCSRRSSTCSYFCSRWRSARLFGGPIGDRIGRKRVIWFSILGVAPFTLALPYVDLLWTGILSFVIGLILSSAFSAIVVFAQELMPGKVGAVSGLFFGFAFGIGGIGAAVLGRSGRPLRHRVRVPDLRVSCRCSAWWPHSCRISNTARADRRLTHDSSYSASVSTD